MDSNHRLVAGIHEEAHAPLLAESLLVGKQPTEGADLLHLGHSNIRA